MIGIVLTPILVGCSGVTGPFAGSVVAPAAATPRAPISTATPTPAPTPSPTPRPVVCIVSTPTQIGTDLTPVVTLTTGLSAAECADSLKVRSDASAWSRVHPPTRLGAAPTGVPVCSKALTTVKGVTMTVWGKAAAQYVCNAIQ